MADLRTLVHEEMDRAGSPSYSFEDLARRRDIATRNRRVTAGIVGLGIAIAGALIAAGLVRSTPTPARPPTPVPTQTPTPTETEQRSPLPLSDVFGMTGRIVYRSGDELIAVDPANPDDALHIAAGQATDPIAWSRNGSRLLVRRDKSGGCRGLFGALSVVHADGSEARLTGSAGCGLGGSFSPDGARVVYDDQDDLYVADTDGGNRRLLVEGRCGAGWPLQPSWSPDGSRIAFALYKECPYTYAIAVVNPDGSGRHEIVDLHQWVVALTWSPDGSQLLFITEAHEIFTVGADGSGLRRIANGTGSLSWSPDGSRIAFLRDHELFTMAADGSDARRLGTGLPSASDGDQARIAWNPIEDG